MATISQPPTATTRSDQPIANANRLLPLRSVWSAGGDAALIPTSQFIWLSACANHLADGELDLVVARQDDQPVALAALLSRNHGWRRYWSLLGEAVYEPADVVYRDSAALDRLGQLLLSRGDPLHFDRLFHDSPTIEMFLRLARGRAIISRRPCPSCPFIPLDERWVTPEDHLNARRRADLRRAQRRAEEHGPVISEILTPSADELDPLLAAAFSIEASGWKSEEKTDLIQDTFRGPFYQHYARAACEAGLLRLSFLRFGDQRVATQIAIQSADALWLLKIGYDPAYARCSPGALLIRDTIRYAAQAGLRSYEFLGRVEPWTEVWTKHEHACVTLDLYPFTAHGMMNYTRSLASGLKQKWKGKR